MGTSCCNLSVKLYSSCWLRELLNSEGKSSQLPPGDNCSIDYSHIIQPWNEGLYLMCLVFITSSLVLIRTTVEHGAASCDISFQFIYSDLFHCNKITQIHIFVFLTCVCLCCFNNDPGWDQLHYNRPPETSLSAQPLVEDRNRWWKIFKTQVEFFWLV